MGALDRVISKQIGMLFLRHRVECMCVYMWFVAHMNWALYEGRTSAFLLTMTTLVYVTMFCFLNYFYRATRMHSADYAVARSLSVRHTPVLCVVDGYTYPP